MGEGDHHRSGDRQIRVQPLDVEPLAMYLTMPSRQGWYHRYSSVETVKEAIAKVEHVVPALTTRNAPPRLAGSAPASATQPE